MSSSHHKIQAMKEGGALLNGVLSSLVEAVDIGITLRELDDMATSLLLKTGGVPAFKKVPGYQWSTCININEGVVHGIPHDRRIRDGDLVSIDVGLFYKGFYTDTSTTVVAGTPTKQQQELISIGRLALEQGISQVRPGNRVGHISVAIEKVLVNGKMKPIPSLTGHGVGRKLHEPPYVPGCLIGTIEQTPSLYEGQTLAIEVIYTTGNPAIVTEPDGWTISTKDGKISGLFEETVLVTKNGPLILTTK